MVAAARDSSSQQQQPQPQPQPQPPQAAAATSAEDEALKRNTDCVYFLASPLTCKKVRFLLSLSLSLSYRCLIMYQF